MKISVKDLKRLIKEAYDAVPRVIDSEKMAKRPYGSSIAKRSTFVDELVDAFDRRFGGDIVTGYDMISGGVMIHLDHVPSEKRLDQFMMRYTHGGGMQDSVGVTTWELVVDGVHDDQYSSLGYGAGGPALIVKLR